MGPVEAVKSVFRNYANFSGRARRSEYWWWFAVQILFYVVAAVLIVSVAPPGSPGTFGRTIASVGLVVVALFTVLAIIPDIAVTTRRLHDIGRSGWWQLIALIPLGGIVLLIFTLMDTQPSPNRWGPPPK